MTERTGFSSDVQRYLDGEPVALAPAERAEAEAYRTAIAAYAKGIPAPGDALDDAVMAEILAGRTGARRRAAWRWFVEPHLVAVRPWAAAAVLTLVASGVGFWAWRTAHRLPVAESIAAAPHIAPPVQPPDVMLPQSVLVRFELHDPNATKVALSGSFNQWQSPGIPMARGGATGTWSVTLPLPVGEHQYGFIVDGNSWTSDPTATNHVDDGFGRTNSVIVVGPRGVIRP